MMDFWGRVEGGRLQLNNADAFRSFISSHKEGQRLRLTVKRPKRTLSQNAYYWGVIIPMISQHTGYTADETHEAMKSLMLGRDVKVFAGREIVMGRSSAGLDTKEFSEYVERCIVFAASDLGIQIPPPHYLGADIPE